MAATIEYLDFIAPVVASQPVEDKQKALDIADGYRPKCLSEAKQDEAQALYAAWLLYNRMQQSQEGTSVPTAPMGVKSLKEGDLAVTYGSDGGNPSGVSDPMGFYGRWKYLNDICRFGAITVGRGVRRGCC